MDLSAIETGISHTKIFDLTDRMTVPQLFDQESAFDAFPRVFATGFMVGAMELTCVELLHALLPEGAGSLGTHINVSHEAATPPGMRVTISASLVKIERRRLSFEIVAHDGLDQIGAGTHERAVIDVGGFNSRLIDKAARMSPQART